MNEKIQRIKEFLASLMKADIKTIEEDWIKFVFLRDEAKDLKYPSIYITDYYLVRTDSEKIISRLKDWQIDKKLEGIKNDSNKRIMITSNVISVADLNQKEILIFDKSL